MKREYIKPGEIEKRSFALIAQELGDRQLDPEQEPVIKRVIHTTADFDYADTLHFTAHAVERMQRAIREGACIVTDTQMAKAGINSCGERYWLESVHSLLRKALPGTEHRDDLPLSAVIPPPARIHDLHGYAK